jgi:hypothetical protein
LHGWYAGADMRWKWSMDCEQGKFDLAAETLTGRNEPRDAALASHLRGCRTPHEWDGVPVPDPGPAIARARRASAGRETGGCGTEA